MDDDERRGPLANLSPAARAGLAVVGIMLGLATILVGLRQFDTSDRGPGSDEVPDTIVVSPSSPTPN